MWRENKYVTVAACYLYCEGIEKVPAKTAAVEVAPVTGRNAGGSGDSVPEERRYRRKTPCLKSQYRKRPKYLRRLRPDETQVSEGPLRQSFLQTAFQTKEKIKHKYIYPIK